MQDDSVGIRDFVSFGFVPPFRVTVGTAHLPSGIGADDLRDTERQVGRLGQAA